MIHYVLLWHCHITQPNVFCFHSSLLKVSLLPSFLSCSQVKPLSVVLEDHQSMLTQGDVSQFIDAYKLLELYHLLLSHLHSQFWKPVDLKSCFMMCPTWVLSLSVLSKPSLFFWFLLCPVKKEFVSLLQVNRTTPEKILSVTQWKWLQAPQ